MTSGSMTAIDARLPLALLRALQQQDTPPELLPDEVPAAIFPNRLGLSGVIEERVRRFEQLARGRKRVDASEATSLLELIARRTDAGAVLAAAGHALAELHFKRMSLRRRIARRLPRRLRLRAAVRELRKAQSKFMVAAELKVRRKPLEVRATDALTARVGDYGGACRLYSALAARVLELSGLAGPTVDHPECQRLGYPSCVWRVEPHGDGESTVGT